MKKITLSAIIIMSSIISVQAQTLNPTHAISESNLADSFKGGYTFSYSTAGTPWNGALISYGGFSNQYDCQISSEHSLGKHISFRTRNGDSNTWNSWNELWHSGNLNNINSDFTAKKLIIKESIIIDGGRTNASIRPLITSGTLLNGEIRGYSSNGNAYDDGFLRLSAGGGTNNVTKSYIELSGSSTLADMHQNIVLGTSGQERMRINSNGNISIGTIVPDEKLTVNGKIHAKEVRIDLAYPMTVPDYVFANDYKLKSLQEVEEFIKQNSHLPEIPSAKEIEKNGLMLAEMNMSLLKKIEELTLYSIEQNKEIQKQNNKILILEQKVKKIESTSK